MKTIVFASVLLLAAVGTSSAQFRKGSAEYLFSGGFQSISSSRDDALTMIALDFSPSFYVTDGLAINPDLGLTSIGGSGDASTALSGLVALSFAFSQGSSGTPYLRVGCGATTGISTPFGFVGADDSKTSVVFLAGLGGKFVVGNSAIVQLELGYTSETIDNETLSSVGLRVGVGLIHFTPDPKE